MATKNFSQMTTKKLQALLSTASDDDKAAIQAVLDARMQSEIPQQQAHEETHAEVESSACEETHSNTEAEPVQKKERMTDEQRAALADSLRESAVNHRCEVVPFNTAEWVQGVIVGVVEDKRSNKVLFAVKLEDGRRVVKAHNSNLIKILDEVVERVSTHRAGTTRERFEKSPWTPEQLEADVAAVACNVGKMVSFTEGEQTIEGRITSIVPDKRSQRCLYCIEIPTPTETDPKATRRAHKVTTLQDLVVAEDFDEIGVEINNKFTARRAKIAAREVLTPEDKFLKAQEAYNKAQEAYAKAGDKVNSCKEAFEAAKAEYEAYMASKENAVEEEPLA